MYIKKLIGIPKKNLLKSNTAIGNDILANDYSYAIFTQIDKKFIPYSFLENNFFYDCSTNNGLSLMFIKEK